MNALHALGYLLCVIGAMSTVFGLWGVAGGLRVIVSGRVDERRQSSKAARFGVPFAVGGIVLLFVGIWLAEWTA